jgi:hypothetical protein
MRLNLAERSTTDIVVLLFTLVICVVLTISIAGAITAKIVHPEMDLTRISESVNQMTSTIIGALVGFISGRAMGRREERAIQEANGGKP